MEKALYSVITEAYVKGISTRKVDDLVKALGIDGISKSEVSRICRALDKDVRAFRARPIEVETPYVWLDATYHKVRENIGADDERVISVATMVAVGSPPPASAPFWAWTVALLRTTSSGPISCAASSSGGSRG